ncbi:sugar transporter STL1 [Sclerotinia borealis F-4128]|uniref:Sugar transporter STL1 n=1 Tax=Sclerotinia borealis (strain F-4128) TaxID=1432307 RepID=W9CPW8_SCLBF|nr:sugar transporter STL1 [Sclerotinia borealis F-4128]
MCYLQRDSPLLPQTAQRQGTREVGQEEKSMFKVEGDRSYDFIREGRFSDSNPPGFKCRLCMFNGVFGNVLVGDDFLRTMGYPSTSVQETLTSVYNLGCFFGALSTIWSGDFLGRPRVILVGSTVIALDALIQARSYGVPQMMVGRVVAGMGTVLTAIIWVLCPFLPDSPRLLIRKGRHEQACEVLAALEGYGATVDSPSVKQQFNIIIKDALDREHMNTFSWFKLLSGKGPSGVLRRMILGAWMQAMNKLSGINVTSYDMTYVFIHVLVISELRARILAAAGSVDYLIFAFLAYSVIERYGRRRVMIISAFACSTCWIIITIVLALSESDPARGYQYGAVAVNL